MRRSENLVLAGVVLAALVLRWFAFAPFDISHADEIMQYLEQGKRLAIGVGIVPWEYQFGARNSLIPQLLAGPFWLGRSLAGESLAGMLAARWTFLAAGLVALPAAWKLGALSGRGHAFMALLVASVWYECVLFSTLLLSEVLASGLIALAAALLLADRPSRAALRSAGLLLGLGVLVRLQYAPFAAVLVLARLRLDRAMWIQLILGGLAAGAIGALSDLAAGQVPFRWIWVNFAYNMSEGRAARFGESGPLQYARWLLIHLGPLAPLILAGALLGPRRYRPLVWALIANLLFHSLIAHKEYRFVWLSTWSIVVLAAIASAELARRLAQRRGQGLNPLLLGALGALWLGASLLAEEQSGGARTLRGGGPIPLAALDAVERGRPCGIALPDQWRAHLVPALLPREVPLFVAPEAVLASSEPLPAALVASADVLIFPARPAGAEVYRELACRGNGTLKACAFVRPGACRPDPYWTYQAALEREGL
ncbi:MAG: hypothetical protein U1E37_06750 [Sphingomonadaceae bacterium]